MTGYLRVRSPNIEAYTGLLLCILSSHYSLSLRECLEEKGRVEIILCYQTTVALHATSLIIKRHCGANLGLLAFRDMIHILPPIKSIRTSSDSHPLYSGPYPNFCVHILKFSFSPKVMGDGRSCIF